MSDIVSPARTRVLLALLSVYERDGRATVRSVALASGLRSVNTVHYHLRGLRDAGLVAWSPESRGTLRPMVRPARTCVRTPSTTIGGYELSGGRAAGNSRPPGRRPTEEGTA